MGAACCWGTGNDKQTHKLCRKLARGTWGGTKRDIRRDRGLGAVARGRLGTLFRAAGAEGRGCGGAARGPHGPDMGGLRGECGRSDQARQASRPLG